MLYDKVLEALTALSPILVTITASLSLWDRIPSSGPSNDQANLPPCVEPSRSHHNGGGEHGQRLRRSTLGRHGFGSYGRPGGAGMAFWLAA